MANLLIQYKQSWMIIDVTWCGNLLCQKSFGFDYEHFQVSTNPRKKKYSPHRRHTSIVRFCGFSFSERSVFVPR